MSSVICTVQFTHPGGEHVLSRNEKKAGSIKGWNYDGHKRKFMRAIGTCLDNKDQLLVDQDLLFWGEWEPTSSVAPVTQFQGNGVMPALVQTPFLQKNNAGNVIDPWNNGVVRTRNGQKHPCERQNTDPFVFADNFYYCCCKQSFKKLRSLVPGSIILFGSTISAKQGGPYFVLDTVFVVGDSRDYIPGKSGTYKQDLKGFIPVDYDQIMGLGSWKNPNMNQLVCYQGATYGNKINGMFSYAPCKLCNGNVIGFPRVRIDGTLLNRLFNGKVIFNDNLNTAPKITIMNSLNESKLVWDEISKQVQQQGLIKGLSFKYKNQIVS